MARKSKSGDKKKKEDKAPPPEVFPAITQAARSSRSVVARRLLASGLYAGQDAVMLALDAEDGQTPSAIAAALGVRAPTITKTINRLAAQGFVAKAASATDRRLTHIHLTETGRGVLSTIRGALKESEKRATTGMSGKEVKTLVKLLHQVEANLQGPAEGDKTARD